MAKKLIHDRFLTSMDFMFFKYFKPSVDGWEYIIGLEPLERMYWKLRFTLSWEMGADVLSLPEHEIVPTFFKKYRQYQVRILNINSNGI